MTSVAKVFDSLRDCVFENQQVDKRFISVKKPNRLHESDQVFRSKIEIHAKLPFDVITKPTAKLHTLNAQK